MLSDRIAALHAPDRAIDAEIAKANGWKEVKHDWFEPPEGLRHHAFLLRRYTQSIDAALSTVQPSMQDHVTHEALKLIGTRGVIVGKFTEQLARAICEVSLKGKGL